VTEIAKRTPFTKRIGARVRDYIRRRDAFRPGERVVVGLSGGPDSTALLIILSRLPNKLGPDLIPAHFDHMLRSRQEAADDVAFCEALCRSLDVPLVTGRGDVKRRARTSGETIEEAARNLRYRFLGQAARKYSATAVTVGHTLDDRAETVMLNIVRGAGLDGLAAMSPRSLWPFGSGPEIARPLLELSRKDTERYCRESGIEPRLDPTNDLPIATRNRMRQELMPVLRSFNPRSAEALARLAEAATADVSFIDGFADSAWREVASRDGTAVVLDRNLRQLAPVIVTRVLRRAFHKVAGESEIDAEHLRRLVVALEKPRAQLSLPGGLVAIVNPTHLRIRRGQTTPARRIGEKPLLVPGKTRFGAWTIDSRLRIGRATGRDPFEATLDAAAVRGGLVVRSRQPGDRLRPLGLRGQKKVQDILVDAKVPREERDSIPIIADQAGIVWVTGHCIADRVKVTPRTQRVLCLRAPNKLTTSHQPRLTR
jgi:tRNA(Ile)-lysidine synthase